MLKYYWCFITILFNPILKAQQTATEMDSLKQLLSITKTDSPEGSVFVEMPQQTEGIYVFNAIGQKVFQQLVKAQNVLQVDISTWPQGVYFIKSAENTDGTTSLWNIPKQSGEGEICEKLAILLCRVFFSLCNKNLLTAIVR